MKKILFLKQRLEAKKRMKTTTVVSKELNELSEEMLDTLLRDGGIKVKAKAKDYPSPRKTRKARLKTKLHKIVDML